MAAARVVNVDGKFTNVDGVIVTIGDWVGFKSDIEQSGRITKIHTTEKGTVMLYLENDAGFEGEYIGGNTKCIQHADDCWR